MPSSPCLLSLGRIKILRQLILWIYRNQFHSFSQLVDYNLPRRAAIYSSLYAMLVPTRPSSPVFVNCQASRAT